jgi:hypothetical protein
MFSGEGVIVEECPSQVYRSRMILVLGSTWAGVIRRREWNLLVKTLSISLLTAEVTLVGSRIRSAFFNGNSFCCRTGGDGRISVLRLDKEGGGGFESLWMRSRFEARRRFTAFR